MNEATTKDLEARVAQLEGTLSCLLYSLNFRSRTDREKARRAAQEILDLRTSAVHPEIAAAREAADRDLRAQHAVATSYHAALDAGLAAADKATRQTSRTLPAKKAARAYHKALTKFATDVGYNPDSVLLMTTNTEIRRFVEQQNPPSALVIFEVGSIDLIPEGVDTEFGYIEFKLPTFAGVLVENQNSWTLAFYAE